MSLEKVIYKTILCISVLSISLCFSLRSYALSPQEEAEYEALKSTADESRQERVNDAKAELKKKAISAAEDYENAKEEERIKNGGIDLGNVITVGMIAPIFSVFLFAFIFAFFEKTTVGGIIGAILVLIGRPLDAINYGYSEYILIAFTQISVLICLYKIYFVDVNQVFINLIAKKD